MAFSNAFGTATGAKADEAALVEKSLVY